MIYSARDIAKQLADRAESVCRWLLPNGTVSAGNWCVGSANGEKGKSMRIQLTGPNAGVWADFAGDAKGDMIGLIKEVRQVPVKEAIKIAKDYLGIAEPTNRVPQKSYKRPSEKGMHATTPQGPVESYLMNERCLDGLTLMAYQVAETETKDRIAFKFISPDGVLENVKYLSLKRDERGKKQMCLCAGCALTLFGWQAIPADAREILITEGEIDAMTWYQMGFAAVSVPNGAGNHDWIDTEWERLLQFDTIYLSYDSDKEGREGVAVAAKRLGLHRCLVVRLPDHKDANEALQADCGQCYFNEAIAAARPMKPDQIKRPMAFREKVVEKFYPPGDVPPGFHPYLFDGKYAARPGEVTVWTGISSHGKSVLLSQLMLEAVLNGYRVAIASMEMKGEQTLHRLICQSEATTRPPLEHIDAVLNWLGGKMWIYDVLGNVPTKTLFELMEYSYARHGVHHIVIDSLMKTTVVSDDYDGQRVFLNQLCTFARDTGSHIHLVAHARKGRDESNAPGKLDVKGSSDIINEPDNVISLWRNREKEQRVRRGVLDPHEARQTPDAIVYCEKQRETGEEFDRKLRYMKGMFRFEILNTETMHDLRITSRIPTVLPTAEEAQPEATEQQQEEEPQTSLPYVD